MPSHVTEILKGLRTTITDNSPAILTAVGVTGTVSTAVLTARAAFRVGKDVNAGHYEPLMEGLEPEVYDAKALVKTYWKDFVPPAAVGLATIACILGANHVSTKRASAMAAAYTLTEKAFTEYKDKVVEQFGANKEQKIRDEIAQDRVTNDPVSSKQVIIAGSGDVLCYETLTGRYFQSSVEEIRRAANTINTTILSDMSVSLNEFFGEIGLPPTGFGEEMGWNLDNQLEPQFSAVMAEDGRPCIAIGYRHTPIKNYHKVF